MSETVHVLHVVEVFPTLQGEGSKAGTPAVFLRLGGCNLWSGHDHQRERGKGDCSLWCDTAFTDTSRMTVEQLVEDVKRHARSSTGFGIGLVVITGGEPLLQLARPAGLALVKALQEAHLSVAVETNGTVAIPQPLRAMLDHVTVSPKALKVTPGLDHIRVRWGTDLKVVVPSPFSPADLEQLALGFEHRFTQPRDDGPDGADHLTDSIQLAQDLGWRVSLQTHKYVGLP
jgi:organic radical activating enzyme